MPSDRKKPELLAPAGGPTALRAAVANGADAVYLGVEGFNARRGAENFSLESLADACRYAHLRGVKVYLTVNILVLPAEFDEALALVERAWAAGIDAIIVQDLGLLRAVRSMLPHVRIHASTQIDTHNTPTVAFLAEHGVSRVTLAREVSIAEIAEFSASGLAEIESFVHGALCVCYSGQCLMSSLIGRRSANRGLCAQPCRLPYELLSDGTTADVEGAHLLSPKDLAGLAVLPSLIASGVTALKIEGRMKSPEYVALVTGVYRAAIDRAWAAPDAYEARDGERRALDESFSRGFSEAYLIGERGNDMMSYRRPNNRGVLVGRIASVSSDGATIRFEAPVESEDTIEFWTGSGRFAQAVGIMRVGDAEQRSVPAGTTARIHAEKPVSAGDRVFRVRNASLEAAARRTFADSGQGEIPLDFEVALVAGSPLSVRVTDEQGRSGCATGAIVERARTKAVTAEEIAEHVGRLGGTPYRIGGWDLTLSPDVGIGYSALHGARAAALADYESAVLAPWAGRPATDGPSLTDRTPAPGARGRRRIAPRMVAVVGSVEAAQACLAAGADEVHVPAWALRSADALAPGIVPLLPRIAHDRELPVLMRRVRAGEAVVCGNLGVLRDAVKAGARAQAHWSLNAVNRESVASLAQSGAEFVWLSPELSGRQIASIAGSVDTPVGIAVRGRQEIMVTEHCVLMAEGPCDRRCAGCERRARGNELRDRKGYRFPVFTDPQGRTHVYNSVPLDLLGALDEVLASGVSGVRLDLDLETPSAAAAAVEEVRSALQRAKAGKPVETRPTAGTTTSGHFFRGIV